MKPYSHKDGNGNELEIRGEEAGARLLVCSGTYEAECLVRPGELAALAAALYKAAGLPVPVILPCPETPDTTALPGALFTLGRPGFVDVEMSTGSGWNVSSVALRIYAASLAMLADEADSQPDPGEVNELAAVLMDELNPRAMGLDGAKPLARAILRAGYRREAGDD
jgi:hypothetical protein